MAKTITDIMNAVDTSALLSRPLSDWRPVLSEECQVYVLGENYVAKRFDQINYKFCEKDEAKEILIDNLYALLRFKYFPKSSEEIDDRIKDIVNSFTANLKTTLKKISFDKASDAVYVKLLPANCVAFRNGVFDFKANNWLFKYDIITLEKLSNKIYMYTNEYCIFWYFDYDFEPLPVNIADTQLVDFIDIMKQLTTTNRNYCFELLYNIAHDANDQFDVRRFEHLCEILGYSVLQEFSQNFVMLIGSGQNGKNSLFDGCFTNRLIPRPAANDLDAIENDRFITGALQNKFHNIFLETAAKTYTESKMIKALTGSMYQTIESKGVSKYSGIINCKYIFAGNDQDKIKFSDTTTGFRRRINMFEIFYHWDSNKRFLKFGDYYDTTFSDSLDELKDDVFNTTAYVYFAMYGVFLGTKAFTKNFSFTENDWNDKYFNINFDQKEKIGRITTKVIYDHLMKDKTKYEEGKMLLYDLDRKRLYNSKTMSQIGKYTYDDMLKLFENEEESNAYFLDNDIYIAVKLLQAITHNIDAPITFTNNLKRAFNITKFETIGQNVSFVKCRFVNGRLKIVSK